MCNKCPPRKGGKRARRKRVISDPTAAFERAYVINLDRRADRWRRFCEQLPADWPFVAPFRWAAVDGRLAQPPAWWQAGRGAWGVYRGFVTILERCLSDGVESVLLMEDDAVCCDDFANQVTQWLRAVPESWQMLYLGGQHLDRPRKLSEQLWEAQNVNRCHAWAVRGEMIAETYAHLTNTPWPACRSGKPAHVDHHLGRLHKRHYEAGDRAVLCPPQWFVGQAADARSDVCAKEVPLRFWGAVKPNKPPAAPESSVTRAVIAVLGPFRGGTSCTAGVLHRLGVSMGNAWATIRGAPRGTYEAQQLAAQCRKLHQEPHMTPLTDRAGRVTALRKWAIGRERTIAEPAPIGAKHPSFCLMVPELLEAWPKVRFVVVERPLEESVASLRRLGWGWPPAIVEPTLRRMVETRDRDLQAVDPSRVLRIRYDELLADPAAVCQRLAEFAGVDPSADQLAAAVEFVDPKLRTFHNEEVGK